MKLMSPSETLIHGQQVIVETTDRLNSSVERLSETRSERFSEVCFPISVVL